MTRIILHLPNERPCLVSVAEDELSCGHAEVAGRLQAAIGFEGEDGLELRFRGKDLGTESCAAEFLEACSLGQPCSVQVLFSVLGGKGGFGALLRGQRGIGKKTTNFDAMRDLSGRRLRHSKAVDRIKEWMEKRKREDEIVNLLTGEGPELPKPTPAEESLDPNFIAKMKKSAALAPAVVREGMRRLDGEGSSAGSTAKRLKTDKPAPKPKAAPGFMTALGGLGDLSGSDAESEEAAGGGEDDVRCEKGHPCAKTTENPKEPGYEEPATCDICEKENLPESCSHFFHCKACSFDVCPDCVAAIPAAMAEGAASSSKA